MFKKRGQNTATFKNWERWLREHYEILLKCGLPLIIIEHDQHWQDFLINGYLDQHVDPSHFSINNLSKDQKRLLKNCLESSLSIQEQETSVLWLRLQINCGFQSD